MLGYFISDEDIKKLGLINRPELKGSFQKVFFVITDKDIIEKLGTSNVENLFTNEKISEIGNMLNKEYYDGAIDVIINFLQDGENKK